MILIGNILNKEGWNNILSEGVCHFQKANWSNLKVLSLCNSFLYKGGNQIGTSGCKNLSKAFF